MRLNAPHMTRLRKDLGITQDELADRVGVTRQAISLMETGDVHEPKYSTLLQLALAFDVPVDDLLCQNGDAAA